MSKDYGQNPTLSYNEYLRVQELIDLQSCRSSPIHHDELLFITVHQAYELWFKQILHEIDAAIRLMAGDRATAATSAMRRVIEIEKLLAQQIHILETMTPISFLGFRDELNPASGFQSMQFREIEIASGVRDQHILSAFANDAFAFERLQARMNSLSLGDAFFTLLRGRGFDAPSDGAPDEASERRSPHSRRVRAIKEILMNVEVRNQEFQLAEALLEHDEWFSLWRSHHINMVERMVGTKPGTGGSEGVGYLRKTLAKRFFPELWEARTYLSLKEESK